MLKIKKFDKQLEKERKKAEKIYKEKQDTVVCMYCSKLMKKNEGSSIYDIGKKELEFCHDECFEKNEHLGTYEDLIKGAKEYNEIHNE